MAKDNKSSFNISNFLNTESLKDSTRDKKKIVDIYYSDLIPHKKNHYSLENIEELADTIQDVGLLQNLIVKPSKENKYTIIAGHRRQLAIKMLVEDRGLKEHEKVSCYILDENEDETITQIKLHVTNTTTRNLNEYEKMTAISELDGLIKQARKYGHNITGRTRKVIGETVGLGETQVQKYMTISDKAKQETKDKLKHGDITVQEAYDSTVVSKPKTNKIENGKALQKSKFSKHNLSSKAWIEIMELIEIDTSVEIDKMDNNDIEEYIITAVEAYARQVKM